MATSVNSSKTGIGGPPGGSDKQLQYNNAGEFGGGLISYFSTSYNADYPSIHNPTPGGLNIGIANNSIIFGGSAPGTSQFIFNQLGVCSRSDATYGWNNNLNDAAAANRDTGLSRAAAAVVDVNNGSEGGAGALRLNEAGADFAAPAANKVVVYSRDNGAGKTQLVARFATGAVQVLAAEP